jgi:hypothetical protein
VSKYREGDGDRRHAGADLRSRLAQEEQPEVPFLEGPHPLVHPHPSSVLPSDIANGRAQYPRSFTFEDVTLLTK